MPRRHDPRRTPTPRRNPLDAAGVTYIDYKDTDLLRKFLSDRGNGEGGPPGKGPGPPTALPPEDRPGPGTPGPWHTSLPRP